MLNVALIKRLPEFCLDVRLKMSKQILVLLGRSGSGKTTILRCLAGLTRPDSGRIEINGQTLYCSEENIFVKPQHRGVGYMFQDYALFPHLTVEKNILYGVAKSEAATEDAYQQLLEILKIKNLTRRYPEGLSGGEKQRVALARALLPKPQMLLLDEPLSALDREIRLELREELKRLHQVWTIPFILVTHDIEEANFMGDQIVRLESQSTSDLATVMTAVSEENKNQ